MSTTSIRDAIRAIDAEMSTLGRYWLAVNTAAGADSADVAATGTPTGDAATEFSGIDLTDLIDEQDPWQTRLHDAVAALLPGRAVARDGAPTELPRDVALCLVVEVL